MATRTLGTNGTTTLTALQWNPAIAVADVAAIQALILDDGMPFSAAGAGYTNPATGATTALIAGGPQPLGVQPRHQGSNTASQIPGSFLQNGQLVIPNRGILRMLPGDFVGVDANGWPILVSLQSVLTSGAYQTSSWTHS
jgi:hypothetical protein